VVLKKQFQTATDDISLLHAMFFSCAHNPTPNTRFVTLDGEFSTAFLSNACIYYSHPPPHFFCFRFPFGFGFGLFRFCCVFVFLFVLRLVVIMGVFSSLFFSSSNFTHHLTLTKKIHATNRGKTEPDHHEHRHRVHRGGVW
jgi:hypothetical protein